MSRARSRLGIAVLLSLCAYAFGGAPPVGATSAQAWAASAAASRPNRFDPTSAATSVRRAVAAPPAAGRSRTAAPPPATPRPLAPTELGTLPLDPANAVHLASPDGGLEVDVPPGAVTAADLRAAGGGLRLLVRRVAPASGSSAGGSGRYTFGTFLVQVLDAGGGLARSGLRKPLAVRIHAGGRAGALDLGRAVAVVNAPLPAGVDVSLPGGRAANATTRLGPLTRQRTTLDGGTGTLGATVPAAGPSTSLSFNTDAAVAAFGKPDPLEVNPSGGALTASYSIDVPAGPGGLTPTLALAYDSASVSDQHNPQGAAPWVGEGWNLSLGSISWAEHNIGSVLGGQSAVWEDSWQLSDAYGTGAELIPPSTSVATYFEDSANPITGGPLSWHTAPETHARVISFTGPNALPGMSVAPPCFRVFLPTGIMEEFGCTPDSLMFYPGSGGHDFVANWLLDLITDPKGNQVHVAYQADTATGPGGVSYPRDAELATVEYDSPGCHSAQAACTGASWTPLVRVSFSASHSVAHVSGSSCPANGTLRCDDPVDLSGSSGLPAPLVQSTLVLNDVQVQVRGSGTGAWNTLRDYGLSFDQSGPTTFTDPSSGQPESAAGRLNLTQLRTTGDDGTTSQPARTFAYTLQREYYEDNFARATPNTNCGPSWNVLDANGQCVLWSQSYDGNSFYLSGVSNGLGLASSFTWQNARSNSLGVVGAAGNASNPFYCNDPARQAVDPCNKADNHAWSRMVLTQDTEGLVRTTQAGQGGTQTSTPVSGTTSYAYQVPFPLASLDCGCVASLYWGDGTDQDTNDFYNYRFMGFSQATVTHPDGSVDVHLYHATEGVGVYDTAQVMGQCHSGSCTNSPWWDLSNAAHGREYELDQYDTNGTRLLRKLRTQWQAVCPPPGVGASPPVTFNDQFHMGTYTWDGHLVSELDPGNPVAACDVLKVRTDQVTVDGTLLATGVRRHPDLVTTDTYDSFGRVTTESTIKSVTVADASDIASNEPTWSGGVSVGVAGGVPGDTDTALGFDGSSGYLATSVPTAAATGSLTLEAWINKSSQTTGPILEYNTGNTIGVNLWNAPTWDGLSVNFMDTQGASHTVQSPAGQFVTGTWYHVVATYDGTRGTLYVNGAQVAQANLGSFTPQTSFPLNVARRPSGSPNQFFAGSIQEVAVYFSALSAARVQAHHTAGSAYQQTVQADSPFSYYRMDEPTPGPSIVKQHGYTTDDAVTATATSATGRYLVDFEGFNDVEDATGARFQCTYTGYDGQPNVLGQTSGLTLGEATTVDRYTKCGTSSNSFTPSGQLRSTQAYDVFGNMVATSDADANAGNSAHLGCHVGSASFSACTAYDATFGVLQVTKANALGQTATSGYTPAGSVPAGGFGRWPVSQTDANGQITTLAYDGLGRQTGITLPGEAAGLTTQATSYAFWCSGTAAQSPCAEIDHTQRLDSTTTVTARAFYDGLGHLVETRSPAPGGQDTVRYTFYDPSQRMVFQSVPYLVPAYAGGPGQAAYSIPDSTQPGTTSTYDGLGRVTSSTDALSNRATKAYTVVCAPPGTKGDTICYAQTLAVDANHHQTGTLLDTFGRTAYVQRYTGNSSSTYAVYATGTYAYDTVGNLIQIKQPDTTTTPKTTFDYDMAGRKTAVSDPDLGSQAYTYDQDGNLIQSVDARGASGTIFIGYDGLDRPIWRNTTNSPAGAYDTYTYDGTAGGNQGVGRLTGETFAAGALAGSSTFAYDGRGRQTASTLIVGTASYPLQSSYDDAGNVLTQTYPDGEVITNAYTAQGWLSSVGTTKGGVTTTLASNLAYTGVGGAFGEVTAMHLGGSYDVTASYDLLDRSTDLKTVRTSDGVVLFDQTRTFDGASNVSTTSTTLPAGTDNQAFCYDELNRLTWAGSMGAPPCTGTAISTGTLTAARYTQSFTYDAQGRLVGGPLGTYTYGSTAHLHAATAVGAGWTAAYDAAGNMTCRAPSSASTCAGTQTGAQLGFNNESELTSWQNAPSAPSASAQFLYDGQGQRVAQIVTQGGTTTTTAYVGGLEEVATSGGTPTTTAYYYAAGKRIGLSVNGVVSYLAADGLGSANVSLSAGGLATASQLYAPYGAPRYSSGTMPTSYGFTGQRADAASGLDYYGARYYDPLAGQFTSADSVLPGAGFDLLGLSRYAYVEANPVNRTDPSGHRLLCGSDGSECNASQDGMDPLGHPVTATGGTCLPGCARTPASPVPPDAKAVFDDNLQRANAIKTSTLLASYMQTHNWPSDLSDDTIQWLTFLAMGAGTDVCRISKCRQAMQAALQFVSDLRTQIAAGWTYIQLGAAAGGGGWNMTRRRLAVREAWALERDLVYRYGQGSVDWAPAEKQELLSKGYVKGYQGHHINSVNGNPELEGDPNNIGFVDDHLAAHGGSFGNPTEGALVDRTMEP